MRQARSVNLPLAAVALLLAAQAAVAAPTVFVDPPSSEMLSMGKISFDPSHSEVLEFETFWVDIMIDAQMLGVTGYDLVIDFDEGLLDVLDVVEGDLPLGYPGETFLYWTDEDTPSDALVVNGAILGGSVDGAGSLVRIEFSALAPGVSPLTFTSIDLRDISNASIPFIEENGDIEIGSVGRVYIDPSYQEVLENESFCVDVSIDALVLGLTGYHFLIDFEESLGDVISVVEADLPNGYPGETFLDWAAEGQPSNALRIDGAFLGGSVDGPGSLVTICFDNLSVGIMHLEFVEVEFRDLENDEIPVGSVPGVVNIDEAVSVERRTWGVIKEGFRWR